MICNVNLFGEKYEIEVKNSDPSVMEDGVNYLVHSIINKRFGYKQYKRIFLGNMYGSITEPNVELEISLKFTGKRFSIQNNIGINVDSVMALYTINNTSIENTKQRIISYDIKKFGIKSFEDIFEARETVFQLLLKKYREYRVNSYLAA